MNGCTLKEKNYNDYLDFLQDVVYYAAIGEGAIVQLEKGTNLTEFITDVTNNTNIKCTTLPFRWVIVKWKK